ncbi:MAG: hypothetical protein NTX47_05115, partial [Candidatus Omnitrophica bacterium]|nr:hypothetical protein [Candidatus Omnitrophota bacterium]
MDDKQGFQPDDIKFERRKFKRIDRSYIVSYAHLEGEELKFDVSQTKNLSEGGLFIAVLESAMTRNFGFEITTCSSIRKDACLFGEGQSRVVVSIDASTKDTFENFLKT